MRHVPLVVVVAVGVLWASFPVTLRDHPAYDAAPIVAAGRLLPERVDSVYGPRGDPDRQRFIEITCEASGRARCAEVASFVSAPIVAVVAQPLTVLELRSAALVIQWLSVASMLVLLVLLWRWSAVDQAGRAIVAATAVALSPVAAAIITLGQSTAMLAVIPLVAVLFPSADRLLGVLVAAIAVLKLFPLVLLGLLAEQGRWRSIVASAAALFGALVAGIAGLGIEAHGGWLRAVWAHGDDVGTSPWNGSLDVVAGAAPALAHVARAVIIAVVILRLRDPSVDRARSWGIVTAGLVAITPQLWAHYLVAVVVAAALVLPRSLRWCVPFVALWSAVPNWLNSLSYENGPLLRASVLAAPLAVVLFAATGVLRAPDGNGASARA